MIDPAAAAFQRRLRVLQATNKDPVVEGWSVTLGVTIALFEAFARFTDAARVNEHEAWLSASDDVLKMANEALGAQLTRAETMSLVMMPVAGPPA